MPVVDRLENELKDRALVMRLNTHHPVSAELADRYRIHAIPTFLVFSGAKGKDGGPRLAYEQVGIPDPDDVLSVVNKCLGSV